MEIFLLRGLGNESLVIKIRIEKEELITVKNKLKKSGIEIPKLPPVGF